jgi:hypothetical protein
MTVLRVLLARLRGLVSRGRREAARVPRGRPPSFTRASLGSAIRVSPAATGRLSLDNDEPGALSNSRASDPSRD